MLSPHSMSRPAAGDTSTPNSTPTPTPTNAGSSSDGGPGSSSVSGSAASAHRDRAAARPTLPDRNVTAVTIEDAYVRFIFYCNPALPLDLDTEQLRDAFRNPPRSGGKTFSTFVIFELVRSFYNKEIRTWTELTTRLGVEPPDPSKDESAQKIAQYGVRLKKWMNSMHVKAFFEYLMNMPNDYWTKIPTDPSPISQQVRDGVALEDDMALRALLPEIRPKRGRKRPGDDEASASPAYQKSRLSPATGADDAQTPVWRSWSSHPESRMPFNPDTIRANSMPWAQGDAAPTPTSRFPNSAITPSTRNSFWDDALEPRSAVTPSRGKLTAQRRGPKNVSSAWRPGITESGAKARGRPPMNRTSMEAPLHSPSPPTGPGETDPFHTAISSIRGASVADYGIHSHQPPEFPRIITSPINPDLRCDPPPEAPPRPNGRPSISLQVPERPESNVRLATPPPAVVVNGEHQSHGPRSQQPQQANELESYPGLGSAAAKPTLPLPHSEARNIPEFYFERLENRTNVDEVLACMVRNAYTIQWYDAEGNPSYPPTYDECVALANATVEHMYRTSTSTQAFLINLAAMTGGPLLLTTTASITRLGVEGDSSRYRCAWEYDFGGLRGSYNMDQWVPHTMYRPPPEPTTSGANSKERESVADIEHKEGPLSREEWQRRYDNLVTVLRERDSELEQVRSSVFKAGRERRLFPDKG